MTHTAHLGAFLQNLANSVSGISTGNVPDPEWICYPTEPISQLVDQVLVIELYRKKQGLSTKVIKNIFGDGSDKNVHGCGGG